jgi:hypothetical protein
MIRPEIPFEGDAVETLLSLANSFLEGLDLSRLSPHPGITGSETSAGAALAQARYQLLIDQLPAATFMAWFENGRCELYVSSPFASGRPVALKETISYSDHSKFRHFHTVVPEHRLHAIQVCPVSRETFPGNHLHHRGIHKFLFDSREPSCKMEAIQTMLAFLLKPDA